MSVVCPPPRLPRKREDGSLTPIIAVQKYPRPHLIYLVPMDQSSPSAVRNMRPRQPGPRTNPHQRPPPAKLETTPALSHIITLTSQGPHGVAPPSSIHDPFRLLYIAASPSRSDGALLLLLLLLELIACVPA